MKNLFDRTVANEVKTRLEKLGQRNDRQWGKMTAPQMLAHCSVSMQWALGEVIPEKAPLPVRVLGRLVKPFVFRNEKPLRKNSPAAKSLIVTGERDLGGERERLSELIDKFTAGGAAACAKNPHSFFGKMTPEETIICGSLECDGDVSFPVSSQTPPSRSTLARERSDVRPRDRFAKVRWHSMNFNIRLSCTNASSLRETVTSRVTPR